MNYKNYLYNQKQKKILLFFPSKITYRQCCREEQSIQKETSHSCVWKIYSGFLQLTLSSTNRYSKTNFFVLSVTKGFFETTFI